MAGRSPFNGPQKGCTAASCDQQTCCNLLKSAAAALLLQVSEANIARAAAEARQADLERQNSSLRLEIAANSASARSTMEEAVRLLSRLSRIMNITCAT